MAGAPGSGHGSRCPLTKQVRSTGLVARTPLSDEARKSRLAELKSYAREHGGECLSDAYLDSKTKLHFRCREGHEWGVQYGKMLSNRSWCPACARKSRSLTTEDMHALAASLGLRFNDEAYLGDKHKHSWTCAQGHVFAAWPSNVKSGHRCPSCWSQRRRTLFGRMLETATKNGWTIHSAPPKEELTPGSTIEATCAHGHRGPFAVTRVLSGFCRYCSRKAQRLGWAKEHLEQASAFAAANGGSVETSLAALIETATPQPSLSWRCHKGHVWSSALSKLVGNSRWCPKCTHGEDTTIHDLKTHALSRRGRCLSDEYVGVKAKYEWECGVGHTWSATWEHVGFGTKTWCPHCGPNVSEQVCRLVFEAFFEAPFTKVRPSWLVGPGGNRLELDGYCEALGIAFEHHGEQHYRLCNFYHGGSEEKFRLQQERDELKRTRCRERGVKLVEIPQLDLSRDHSGIVKQVIDACVAHEVTLPRVDFNLDIAPAFADLHFESIKARIEGNGGKVLSYTGVSKRTRYECRCGSVAYTSTRNVLLNVKNPGVCKPCVMQGVSDRNEPVARARNDGHVKATYGGRCIRRVDAKRWVFQCSEGHEFEAAMGNVYQGKWCPACRQQAHERKVHARGLAAGFECLTAEPSMNGMSRWRCRDGHEFERSARSILPTSRCPVCLTTLHEPTRTLSPRALETVVAEREAQEQRLKDYVASKGGHVVAGSYVTDRSVFEVDCGKGHRWSPMAVTLLKSNASWCPRCAGRHKTTDDLAKIATTRDPKGVCHSNEYLGANVKHEWGCGNGHRWLATVSNVMTGYWCPECAGKKKGDMAKMRDLAERLGGSCLSTEYLGAFRHLRWACGTCGHEWEAMPTNVQRGKWCPPCSRAKGAEKRKQTLNKRGPAVATTAAGLGATHGVQLQLL